MPIVRRGRLFSGSRNVLAGVDRLQHRRDLTQLRPRYMSEDVAVEVNHALLSQRIIEVLGGTLGKTQAGI